MNCGIRTGRYLHRKDWSSNVSATGGDSLCFVWATCVRIVGPLCLSKWKLEEVCFLQLHIRITWECVFESIVIASRLLRVRESSIHLRTSCSERAFMWSICNVISEFDEIAPRSICHSQRSSFLIGCQRVVFEVSVSPPVSLLSSFMQDIHKTLNLLRLKRLAT